MPTIVEQDPGRIGEALVLTGEGFGVKASLSTALGSNKDLTLTAVDPGTGGNSISLTVAVAGASTALSVTVSGNDITVHSATNGSSAATSTAADIVAALKASAPASALITAALKAGQDGSGVTGAVSKTNLANGAAEANTTVRLLSDGYQLDLENFDIDGTFDTSASYTFIPNNRNPINAEVYSSAGVSLADCEILVEG